MGAGGSEEGGKRLDESDVHEGGSVKRARQSVNADLPDEPSVIGTAPPPVSPVIPQTERTQSSTPSTPSIPPSSPEASLQAPEVPIRSALRPRPPTILIPGLGAISASQWTQRQGNSFWQPDARYQPQEQTVGRGRPPPRPPRPHVVPSLHFEGTKDDPQAAQPQEQAFIQENQPNREEGMSSKPPDDDGTRISDASSDPSTEYSSMGVPEFSLPPIPPTPSPPVRRSANLGPPPSARKGASMYYPQNSYVSPIPEEMSEGHGSYASSHVIPTSWGDGPPSYYMGESNEEGSGAVSSSMPPGGHESSSTPDAEDGAGNLNSSRRSKGSSKEVSGNQMLGFQEAYSPAALSPISAANSDTSNSRLWSGGAVSETGSPVDQQSKNQQDPEGPRSKFLAPPPLISPASTGPASPIIPTPFSPYSESQSPADPRIKHTLGNPDRGGPFSTNATVSPLTSTAPSTGEKEENRPVALNLTGPQDGGVRSSQSRLPDMIRRATKLASNLDRSRTASRVGSWDGIRRNKQSTRGDDSKSISDILAAFPSPSSSSPTGDRQSQRRTSPVGKSSLSNVRGRTIPAKMEVNADQHQGRRCCGMPAWVFALLCLVLLLLITATVIIPVTLIVLPKQRGNKVATLSSCIQDFPCINGGMNLLIRKSCRCVCSNGFTGSVCRTAAERGCTTADFIDELSGTIYRNATTGTGIPRLLLNAYHNFSIPLDTTSLLSLFSSTNLSCSDENQLITFNERERRRSLPLQFAIPQLLNPNGRPERGPSVLSPHTTEARLLVPTLLPRDDAPPSPAELAFFGDGADMNVVTSNEIILAGPTGVVTPNPSSTTTGSEIAVQTSATAPVPQTAFDFARVAVLFIFQENSLNDAVVARDRLSEALKNAKTYNSKPVNAGQSIQVDFGKLTLSFGNGTVFGGGPLDV